MTVSGDPVPHQARAQLGERVGRIAPGEHVEHRREGGLRERRRRAPPAAPGPAARRPARCPARSWRRAAGPARPAGWRGPAAPRSTPSRIRSVTTAACTRSPRYFGKTTPVETAPTWCPARPTRCSPEATEGGDSTWIDQVDRAHVDAQLQAGGGDHGGQPAGLEVLLDLGPLLLGDRAVVGPGEQRRGTLGRTRTAP